MSSFVPSAPAVKKSNSPPVRSFKPIVLSSQSKAGEPHVNANPIQPLAKPQEKVVLKQHAIHRLLFSPPMATVAPAPPAQPAEVKEHVPTKASRPV